MADLSFIKLIIDGGASAALIVVVLYVVKVWMPEQRKEFLQALKEKRDDDTAQMNAMRADFLRAEQHRTEAFTAALTLQRQDFLEATKAKDERFWAQMEAQRLSHEREQHTQRECHEREQHAERDQNERIHDQLSKAIKGLSDVIIFQGKDRRAEDTVDAAQGPYRRRQSDTA
jgi:hypothetical protein